MNAWFSEEDSLGPFSSHKIDMLRLVFCKFGGIKNTGPKYF